MGSALSRILDNGYGKLFRKKYLATFLPFNAKWHRCVDNVFVYDIVIKICITMFPCLAN